LASSCLVGSSGEAVEMIMNYQTVDDIYTANEKAREHLLQTLNSISPEEATALPDGEKWNIQQIAEHLSIVDQGISRLCKKLVDGAKTEAKPSNGTVTLSHEFNEKLKSVGNAKVTAPERVHPTGDVNIAEAIQRMKQNREAFASVREDLRNFDVSANKFPHPFFGDISAIEWMIVAGGHEMRHAKQIERLIVNIRK
jgi:DinB superfamily